MAEPFPLSGDIDPKAFPFLLADLHRRGATGSLKVEGPSHKKQLFFRGGRILFGSSNDPGDQLGAILIEQGKITPEQLDDVNAKVGPGNPLAKVLAESGYVNQRELGDAARIKVERILSDVIGYASGSFEFEDGVLPKGAVDLKLSTEKLMLSAVKRLDDRAFALRHLDGLSVVLTATEELAERIEEMRGDCAELPERLDGRRTLKEAAALTRLEEFEAAKVACALLFLGLVRRVEPGEELPAAMPAGHEIDLGQDAHAPFADSSIDATVALLGSPSPSDAPFFTGPGVSPASPVFPEPVDETPGRRPSHEAAFPITAPSSPDFTETEAFSLPPLAPEPPSPAPRPPGPKLPPIDTPPLSQPAVRPPATSGAFPALDEPSPAVAGRPSKEDLAALDALLNPSTTRGLPPAPAATARGNQRWEPQFRGSAAPPRRAASKGGGRSRMVLFGTLVVAAFALGAGGWYYVTTMQPNAAVAVKPPRPAPTAAAASPPPAPTPAASVAATPATALPTAAPLPSPPLPTTAAATGRELLQRGSFSEAADAFASKLKAAHGFSVQVLVACSTDTIQKAAQAVPSEELYILPVNFKGRSCYRLCWGVYDSEARAGAALQSLPAYFVQGGATPKVQPISGLLP